MNHKCLVILEQKTARAFHKNGDAKDFQVLHCCGEETIPIDEDMEIFCNCFSNNIIAQLDDEVDLCVLYDACNSNHEIEKKLAEKKIHLAREAGYWSKQKIGEVLSKQFKSIKVTIKSETEEVLTVISTGHLEFVKCEEKVFYTGYSFEKEPEQSSSMDDLTEHAFARHYLRKAENWRKRR